MSLKWTVCNENKSVQEKFVPKNELLSRVEGTSFSSDWWLLCLYLISLYFAVFYGTMEFEDTRGFLSPNVSVLRRSSYNWRAHFQNSLSPVLALGECRLQIYHFFQSAVPKLSPKSGLSECWKCALHCCHCHCHSRCQRVQLTRHMTSHPAVNCVIVACQSSPTQLPFIDWIIWSVAGAFTRKCDWSWFVQTFSSAAN